MFRHFYPRSPCGERPDKSSAVFNDLRISIHALLAESDGRGRRHTGRPGISIHALLAESDGVWPQLRLLAVRISIHALLAESDEQPGPLVQAIKHFYPRSPCGERRSGSRLRSRRARHFYPRSPCGERR